MIDSKATFPPLRILGLMSGTSLDGLDLCLATLQLHERLQVQVEAFATRDIPSDLRAQLLRHMQPATSQVDTLCALNMALGRWLASAAQTFLADHHIPAEQVDLIASHGQTLWHIPPTPHQPGSTLQIGEGAMISQLTGITTISNFRPADMALGGQGAPLAHWLDWQLLRHQTQPVAFQNLGGIGNVAWIDPPSGQILAFDTGPANMVVDRLITLITHGQERWDKGGQWAHQGQVLAHELQHLLADPYFAEPPPKSTGRERFGQAYTDALYARWCSQELAPADMVATATALTLESIVQAYQQFFPAPAAQIYVSGGGVHNQYLMAGLQARLAPAQVLPYDSLGISADAKEALAFAGLAYATWFHLPSNLPAVTGASGPAVLGQIHPGHNYRQLWAKSAPMLC